MSNEIVAQSGIPSWIQELSLPKLIAGPAGEALSRLVGAAADIPAAWLEQKPLRYRNITDARKAVSGALAEAAAEHARKDADLVEQATDSLIARSLRRQTIRESVAQKTIEHLQDEPGPDQKPATPEDDWLNIFERYAGDASSGRLQDIWSRVLAGQIRKPGAFSLKTLGFLSELDERICVADKTEVDRLADRPGV